MTCLCPCEIPRDICASFDWTWKCDTCGRRYPAHRWGCDGKAPGPPFCRTVSMVVVKVHALATANKKKRKDLERAEGLLAGAVEEARALKEKIATLRAKVKRLRAEAAKLTTPVPPPGVDLDGPAEQPVCKGRRGS